MKTTIFKQTVLSEQRKGEIKKLTAISDSLSKYIINIYENVDDSFSINRNFIAEIANDTNEEPELILDIIMATSYILRSIKEFDDNVNDFCDDLNSILRLSPEEKEKLSKYILKIYPVADIYFHVDRIKSTLYKDNDSLDECEIITKLIPIFKKDFDPEKDNIKGFEPEIICYEPVVDLFLRKNNDEVHHFQLQKKQLIQVINLLESAEKEIQILKKKS